MKWLYAAIFGFLLASTADAGEVIEGQPEVIDGDTLRINGTVIRLWGIDAPELAQTCSRPGGVYSCGQHAANWVMMFVNVPLRCAVRDHDRYGRAVAQCRGAGVDVASLMVERGIAVDYPRYSKGWYQDVQLIAQQNGAGLWAGGFEMPEEWRRKH